MSKIESNILNILNEAFGDGNNISLLIGFSGGADSVCLLHAISMLISRGEIRGKIAALHINHNLRAEESDGDEDFCRKLCQSLGVEFYAESVDAQKAATEMNLSLETAARELRLGLFKQYCRGLGLDFVATGHHLNDNAETIVQRIMRGTGFRGLSGILPCREVGEVRIVSPLISTGKDQILNYCRDNHLAYRTDSSNLSDDYTRNYIRNRLLPELEKDEPQLPIALFELGREAEKLRTRIDLAISDAWNETVEICEKDSITINQKAFNDLGLFVRQEILRRLLGMLGVGENKLSSLHYEAVLAIAQNNDSTKYQLPDEVFAFSGYGKLILLKLSEHGIGQTIITRDGLYRFRDWQISVHTEKICKKKFAKYISTRDRFIAIYDRDDITLPLVARERTHGDRFSPFGANGSQKVGRFLIRAKVNQLERSKAVVFEDKNNRIVWVAPHRTSEIGRVTDKTENVLIIKLKKV